MSLSHLEKQTKEGRILIYYVITNGEKFICRDKSGKYVFTTLKDANRYKSKDIAVRVMNTQLSKIMQKNCLVARQHFFDDKPKNPKTKKETSNKSKSKDSQNDKRFEFKNDYTVNIQYWLDKIDFEKNVKTEALQKSTKLLKILKEVEDYMCDITHYIEFNKLNRDIGYKLESYLHDLLTLRRQVKNELNVIELIIEFIDKKDYSEFENLKNKIKREQNQFYYPRKLLALYQLGAGKETDEAISNYVSQIRKLCNTDFLGGKVG